MCAVEGFVLAWLSCLLLVGAGPLAGEGHPDVPACVAPGLPVSEPHQAAFDALNHYRAELGLRPLIYSKALELAANEHARDMFERDYVAHQSPDGTSPADRAAGAGFCHRRVGENVFWGFNKVRTAAEATEGWKRSPGHDRNMRRASYRFVGIGFHAARRDGGTHYHWVQLFASGR